MCRPHVIVYLDVSAEVSMDRILSRARGMEAKISLEYLEALHRGYVEFIDDISRVIPVISVDYERFGTAEEMAEVIRKEYFDQSFLREATRFDPTR
jgi:deoxyadenosine kinase